MAFSAVNSLFETLEDLLRFTSIVVEIKNWQLSFRSNGSCRDSLQHPLGYYVQQAAEGMLSISGFDTLPFVRYPHIHPYKDPTTAMEIVFCNEFKLAREEISQRKTLYFLVARAKEISGLCKDLGFILSFFKDLASICQDLYKAQYLEGNFVKLACRTEDVIEGYLFDHSIHSKTFNFINHMVNEPSISAMEDVPFLKEILNVFDKKNGIQEQLLQTLREIDLIKREVKKIYDKAPIVTENLQSGQNNAIADALEHVPMEKNEVFNIDNDGFLSVLDRVMRGPSPLKIVPIVGMGSISKTTLAQRVYDYPLICRHFYIRAWVVVSQVHQAKDILIGLLRCINQITDEAYGKSNGQLTEELYRSLKGKRFLIVLDNIWSTKAWDGVKRCFPDDKNGSRIVLTTRLMKVADYVNPKQPPHYVNLLDIDESWNHLQHRVFREEPYHLEFEDVGRIEILDVFDKKNRIQKHWVQTLREIDFNKREVKNIYDKAPIVTENQQLGQNTAIADALQHVPMKKNEVFDVDNDGFLSVLDRVIRVPSALEIVPIVGMGGIGKTTLAHRVYDYPLTCHRFYIRAWVVVSQVHQAKDILIGLLRCINQITDEAYGKSNGQLAEELYRSLKGKRFLIVLDNVWSTKAWDDIKRCFPDDKNGSRIVLTTRLMKVADYVNPKQPPHYVNLLDIHESWKLQQHKVFREEPYPIEFEDVGRRIARKCNGLPLSIVVIAGILCKSKRTHDCWEGIAKSVSSVVSSDPEQCLEVLALSYNHMPGHLKTCFLYMGAFPENCEIEVPKLINLWISEGFLDRKLTLTPLVMESLIKCNAAGSPSVNRSIPLSRMEFDAQAYLEELIDRNLVLVGKRSFCGKIKTCHLHDLMQDLCLREAQKAKFMHVMRRVKVFQLT